MAVNALFQITRDQVITGAMQLTGELAKGEPPDSTSITDYLVFLQSMLKSWDVDGYKGWLYKTLTLPCVANQVSYTIGNGGNLAEDRPVRMPGAFTIDTSNNKQSIIPYTKQQFENLTPKNQPGPTTGYFYDPQLILGIFNPWPVPTDTTRNFGLIVQRPIADIGASSSVFDIPQEGFLALIWGLANEIAPISGTEENTIKRIESRAPGYIAKFLDFAEEDGSVFFQPNAQGGVTGSGRGP